MPVTKTRNGLYDLGVLDGTNTARFLFGDDDLGDSRFAATTNTDESFPTLVRRDDPMVCVVFFPMWFCFYSVRFLQHCRGFLGQVRVNGHSSTLPLFCQRRLQRDFGPDQSPNIMMSYLGR